jgi:hypothetical protein
MNHLSKKATSMTVREAINSDANTLARSIAEDRLTPSSATKSTKRSNMSIHHTASRGSHSFS